MYYDPLTTEKAYMCLRDLVENMHLALEAYHGAGLAHLDVRLENVCFNENFQPVLIDLDRSCRLSYTVDTDCFAESCMYNYGLTPGQHDYMQPGWLATWVAAPTDDCHQRKFEDLAALYQKDMFLRTLITEGVVNSLTCPDAFQLSVSVCFLLIGNYEERHMGRCPLFEKSTRTVREVLLSRHEYGQDH